MFRSSHARNGVLLRDVEAARMPDDDRRLVYSTDGNLPLPAFDRPKPRPSPTKSGVASVPDDGVVRVGCEKRRGGMVTLVYGLATNELDAVAAVLKKRCGAGGTAKDGIVSIQGDKRDTIIAYFTEAHRRTKRMGG
jgi:translation initiation factor 1